MIFEINIIDTIFMKTNFLLIVALLMLNSCKKADAMPDSLDFLFNDPQPINDSELTEIPIRFRGRFINSDSLYLQIDGKTIVEENYYRFKKHKSEMDSLKNEYDIVDGKYIAKISNEEYIPKIIGDSIVLSFKYVDTIFIFSNKQNAKRVNGHLVISEKDSMHWKIKVLQLEKNILKIKQLYSKEDLNRLDAITKNKSRMIDSAIFIITPTRSEFVKILNLKALGFEQKFKKIK